MLGPPRDSRIETLRSLDSAELKRATSRRLAEKIEFISNERFVEESFGRRGVRELAIAEDE